MDSLIKSPHSSTVITLAIPIGCGSVSQQPKLQGCVGLSVSCHAVLLGGECLLTILYMVQPIVLMGVPFQFLRDPQGPSHSDRPRLAWRFPECL